TKASLQTSPTSVPGLACRPEGASAPVVEVAPMSDTASGSPRIAIRPNGPYVVSGGLPLVVKTPIETDKGEPIGWLKGATLDEGPAYALCRCGGSSRKPFCDGTHASNGFDGSDSEH